MASILYRPQWVKLNLNTNSNDQESLQTSENNDLIKRYGNKLINPRPCRVCQEQQLNQPGVSAEIYMEPFSKPSAELTGDEAPGLSKTNQQSVFY